MRFIFLSLVILLFVACTQERLPEIKEKSSLEPVARKSSFLDRYIDNYLNLHYRPWKHKSPMYTDTESFWGYSEFTKNKGLLQEDLTPYEEKWFDEILAFSNLEEYNTTIEHAITIQNTNLRVFPTQKPLFRVSYHNNGYPFDLLQNSNVALMSPVNILNYSQDKTWAFVETSFATGWIKTEHLALVDEQQLDAIKNLQHIVITEDGSPIYKDEQPIINVKTGIVLPITHEDNQYFYPYILDKDSKKIATKIEKKFASSFPLEFNEENIQKVADNLKGESYGWGGIGEKRDCSALTKDFMSVFGVWLPRNSGSQRNIGDFFDLSKFADREKDELIKKYATPYLSLVYFPGHIMLYVGNNDDNALVLHNIWGIRTIKNGVRGREIIGKSIVSDLFLGKNLKHIDKDNMLISRVTGFNTIGLTKSKKYAIKLGISYSDYISHIEDNIIYFKDNTTLIFDDNEEKTLDELMRNADAEDMFKFPYVKGNVNGPFNSDPGRFRDEKFFKKIYGNTKEDIEKNLIEVVWLPKKIGKKYLFNKNNGAADALQKVSNELDKLGNEFLPYLENIGGTYNHREIADTNQLSTHSFGIAIDINTEKSRYWQWDKEKNETVNTHKIPQKIINIFEKHGFIWGGKWQHYDTMHFEFRPELL